MSSTLTNLRQAEAALKALQKVRKDQSYYGSGLYITIRDRKQPEDELQSDGRDIELGFGTSTDVDALMDTIVAHQAETVAWWRKAVERDAKYLIEYLGWSVIPKAPEEKS